MKATAVLAIMPVMCALLALPSMTDGAKDRIRVNDDDVVFSIDRYDDGRSLPYVVSFTKFGFKSWYKFDNDGRISKITTDEDKYFVKYRKNGRVKTVTRAGARRDLAEEVEDGVDTVVQEGSPEPRRRLYACDDCAEAWNAICYIGVGTVCDLEGYGDPFLSPAETSLEFLCSTLGGLCENMPADEACSGQCEECLAPLTITLEWSTDSEENPAYLDLYVVEPSNNLVFWNSPVGGAGSLGWYENKREYTVFPGLSSSSYSDSYTGGYSDSYTGGYSDSYTGGYSDSYTGGYSDSYTGSYSDDSALGTYLAFAELYAGDYPVYWTMTAVTGSGEEIFSGEGEFSGECGSSSSESSASSTFGTTRMFYGFLFEYIDNGCDVFFDAGAAAAAAKSARPGRA